MAAQDEPLGAKLADAQRRYGGNIEIVMRDPATGISVISAPSMTPSLLHELQVHLAGNLSPRLEARMWSQLWGQNAAGPQSNPVLALLKQTFPYVPIGDAIDRFLYKCYYQRMEDKEILGILRDENPEWHQMTNGIKRQNRLKRAKQFQARHGLPPIPLRKKRTI
jgi:hypothetical protein